MASVAKPKRRTRTKAPGVYRSISGRYEIAYRDSDGRLCFETVDGNLNDAKTLRADRIARLGRGEKIRRADLRFGEYADEIVAQVGGADRTKEKHDYHLRIHLKPRFGRKKLNQIDVDAVAALVSSMSKRYSGATIAGTLGTLSLVMSKAHRKGYAPSNPVKQLDKDERPKFTQSRKRVLSAAEIKGLLDVSGETFAPVVATMIFTGLRLGEVLGLRWENIDRDAGYIYVRHQLSRKRELAELKTEAARRDVVLLPELTAVLLSHRMRSPFKRPLDFVFTAPDGRPRDHRSTSKGIERAVARAKLGAGVSAHNLRHTFASHMIVGLKEDAVTVAGQLGHTNPSFTQDTYSHEFDKVKHDDERRKRYSDGFGSLLASVNSMSTDARNEPQPEAPEQAAIVVAIG